MRQSSAVRRTGFRLYDAMPGFWRKDLPCYGGHKSNHYANGADAACARAPIIRKRCINALIYIKRLFLGAVIASRCFG